VCKARSTKHYLYIRASLLFKQSSQPKPARMAQKQLSEFSTEELNKNLKLLRVAIAVISASIGVMIVSAIVSYSKKGFSVFTILPLLFLPILTMNIVNMKKIKAELQARK
jgi:hypothetical protein